MGIIFVWRRDISRRDISRLYIWLMKLLFLLPFPTPSKIEVEVIEGKIMRLLHTMLRVGNLEESLKFYCEILGMKLLRRKDYPGGEFTLAFVGYGDESDNTVLELTYNWGKEKYDLGDAYGHIALGVDDIYGKIGRAHV